MTSRFSRISAGKYPCFKIIFKTWINIFQFFFKLRRNFLYRFEPCEWMARGFRCEEVHYRSASFSPTSSSASNEPPGFDLISNCWQVWESRNACQLSFFKVPDWPFLRQIHPIRFFSLWNCQAFKLPIAKIWKQNLFSFFRYSESCFFKKVLSHKNPCYFPLIPLSIFF